MDLIKEKEIQNKTAFHYDSVYGSLIVYKKRWNTMYKLLVDYLKKSDSILELGCGTASFLNLLEKKGYNYLD